MQYEYNAEVLKIKISAALLQDDSWSNVPCLHFHAVSYTRTVCKVRGLTLLLRFGTLWRCGDGLFFPKYLPWQGCTSYKVLPTSRKCAVDHWSLWNFLH